MASRGWDGPTVELAMPVGGTGNDATINTAAFSVPKGAHAITFCMPALAGTGASVKIQALYPDTDQATEVWADVSAFNPADGTYVALDGILEGVVSTIPTRLTGGGVLRLVASESQASGPSTIKLVFHMRG